ncbi:unnamed protein product [Choristocarpus tenellus]
MMTAELNKCLLKLRTLGDAKSYNPIVLRNMLAEEVPMFSVPDQQDAEECFQELMRLFTEERPCCDSVCTPWSPGLGMGNRVNPLRGSMDSLLQCSRCGDMRKKTTFFVDLSLTLPQAKLNTLEPWLMGNSLDGSSLGTLGSRLWQSQLGLGDVRVEDCLQDFTRQQRVEGVECIRCTLNKLDADIERVSEALQGTDVHAYNGVEKVAELSGEKRNLISRLERLKKAAQQEELSESPGGVGDVPPERVAAYKQLLLSRLPGALCLHFHRRHPSARTGRMIKLCQKVRFGVQLNMEPYCTDSLKRSYNSLDAVNDRSSTKPLTEEKEEMRALITTSDISEVVDKSDIGSDSAEGAAGGGIESGGSPVRTSSFDWFSEHVPDVSGIGVEGYASGGESVPAQNVNEVECKIVEGDLSWRDSYSILSGHEAVNMNNKIVDKCAEVDGEEGTNVGNETAVKCTGVDSEEGADTGTESDKCTEVDIYGSQVEWDQSPGDYDSHGNEEKGPIMTDSWDECNDSSVSSFATNRLPGGRAGEEDQSRHQNWPISPGGNPQYNEHPTAVPSPGRVSGGTYNLCAVIVHHGSANGGHYAAFRRLDKVGEQSNSSQGHRWVSVSDEDVRLVKEKDVLSSEAYMLFYTKAMA